MWMLVLKLLLRMRFDLYVYKSRWTRILLSARFAEFVCCMHGDLWWSAVICGDLRYSGRRGLYHSACYTSCIICSYTMQLMLWLQVDWRLLYSRMPVGMDDTAIGELWSSFQI